MTSRAPIRTLALRLLLAGVLVEGLSAQRRETLRMAEEARTIEAEHGEGLTKGLARRCEELAKAQISEVLGHIRATDRLARRLASHLDGQVPYPVAKQGSVQRLLSRMRLRLEGERGEVPFEKIQLEAEVLDSIADALDEPSARDLDLADVLSGAEPGRDMPALLPGLLVPVVRILEPGPERSEVVARKAIRKAETLSGGLEARALVVIVQHPDYAATRVAKEVGCARQTLYRYPRIVNALKARAARKDEQRSGVLRRGVRQSARQRRNLDDD